MPVVAHLATARPAMAPFAAMGIVWGTFAAALPDTKAMLGVSEQHLGLLLLAGPVGAVTAMLLAPRTGTALGRVALPVVALAMALAISLPGQVAAAHSLGLAAFALALACCGASTGTLDVLMNARVAALENRHGIHLMNLAHALYSLGYALAALATGWMRSSGWSLGEIFAAASLAAGICALLSIERDGRILGLRQPGGGAAPGLGPLPLLGGMVVMVAFLTENAAEAWSALHIERTLGGSPAEGAMGPALLALTMAAARLAGQGIVARVSAQRLLGGGAVIAAAGAVIAALAVSPQMAHAGFVIMGVGASVLAPTAFSLVGRMAEPELRARAVARATMLGYCGYFVGPPILGLLAGAVGLRAAFLATALALLAVLLVVPRMLPVARRAV